MIDINLLLQNFENDIKENILAISVTGSYRYGLQSSTSDVDLNFFFKDNTYLDKMGDYIVKNINGKKYEILLLSADFLNEKLNNNFLNLNYTFKKEDLDFLIKVFDSLPLYGHDYFEEIYRIFPSESLKKSICNRLSINILNRLEDIRGMFCDRELVSTIFCLNNLADYLVDLLLVNYNDYYLRDKWKVSRIQKKLPEKFYKEYLNYFFSAVDFGDEESILNRIYMGYEFCRKIIFYIEFDCFEEKTLIINSNKSDHMYFKMSGKFFLFFDKKMLLIDELTYYILVAYSCCYDLGKIKKIIERKIGIFSNQDFLERLDFLDKKCLLNIGENRD